MVNFYVNEKFKGSITSKDILNPEGTLTLVFQTGTIDYDFFKIEGFNFLFTMYLRNGILYCIRNDHKIKIDLRFKPPHYKHIISLVWTKIIFELYREGSIVNSLNFTPELPPNILFRWAREQNLIKTETYDTEELFRNKIHSILLSINDKLMNAGNYDAFWNISYSGSKIIDRLPKREIEAQPTFKSLIDDQIYMSSIDIISEYESSVGRLDFLFIGRLTNGGSVYFCVEFKNAHSSHIDEGLLVQLPKYMETRKATYGAYCVLNYKGENFLEPSKIEDIEKYLMYKSLENKEIDPNQIRVFVFNLSSPVSASKIKLK